MRSKKIYEIICVFAVVLAFITTLIIGETYYKGVTEPISDNVGNGLFVEETIDALSKRGSYGSEVRQIQTKLKSWGYYNGDIDGIYGSRTESAVKSFQRKNGLTADGIAGPKTLSAMGISSGGSGSSSVSASSANIELLARIIYGEARGEPYVGQVAIAAVVLNRVEDSRFPKTIAGVIYQSGAFDAVSDGQINYTPNNTAYQAARDAINGWDPTYGSIYYYNPSTATNKWIKTLPITVRIGKHVFSVGK